MLIIFKPYVGVLLKISIVIGVNMEQILLQIPLMVLFLQ